MRFRRELFCSLILGVLSFTARADFITGYGWVSTDPIVSSATAATAASLSDPTCSHGTAACTPANADVTFTTTGIKFTPPFLTSGSFGLWLASSAFPLNGLVDLVPNSPLSPSIWEFVGHTQVTGTLGSPQSFTFEHDDGMTFVVNGQTVVSAPGPTAPVVTTASYTGGASLDAPFTLIYAECCSGQAVLTTDLVGPGTAPSVPEPGTFMLLGGSLVALVAGRKLLAR